MTQLTQTFMNADKVQRGEKLTLQEIEIELQECNKLLEDDISKVQRESANRHKVALQKAIAFEKNKLNYKIN